MNVRSLHTTAPAHYEAARTRSERAPSHEQPHLQKVTDSLILSHRARVVLDEMRSQPELDLSLKSKMHPEQLTDQRTYDVVRRIERGFYDAPHVLHRVAAHVGSALMYGP